MLFIPFVDRKDGGKQLAQLLSDYKNQPNGIVIGLPRGGVVTAAEVAKELHLPLDIVVPRKIGAPFHEELAIGAVTQDGDVVWNEDIIKHYNFSPDDVGAIIEKERAESARRVALYRHGKSPLNLTNKTVILVDDGIATGATIRAAVSFIKKHGAQKIIVAAPIAAADACAEIAHDVDEVVAVIQPKHFGGISAFYQKFDQTSDREVMELLAAHPTPLD